jgi:glycosyltransferase involved in cell wall biosynthesis
MSLAASVLVPTFRRPDLLRRCLAKLAQQDIEPDQFEVIIADDGNDGATKAAVDEFGKNTAVRFRYVRVGPAHGPAAARNAGWRAARGEVIAFTDDDCLPEPNWLSTGMKAIRETGAAAATGRVIVPLPEKPTDYQRDAAGLSRGEFVTANCFVRRAILEQIGGFDERFTVAWREDSDLQFTLLERGSAIEPAPQAVVVHPVRPAKWGVSLSQQKKVRFDALLYKKHPRLYRERIADAPLSYYAITGTIVAAAIGAATGPATVAMLPAGCWALLTGRFCARRLRGCDQSLGHVAEMAVTSALIPPVALYWRLYGSLQNRTVVR